MTSELALHAYIFLGNALNFLLNGAPTTAAELQATPAALAALHREIEPLTPQNILEAVARFPEEQKILLLRASRW